MGRSSADEADCNGPSLRRRERSVDGGAAGPGSTGLSGRTVGRSWFAADPSKAWWEKFSLIWAPASMAVLLGGFLGSGLWRRCGRAEYTLVGVLGCLPGVVVPALWPGEADRRRGWRDLSCGRRASRHAEPEAAETLACASATT